MDPNVALAQCREAASKIIEDLDHERQPDPDNVQVLAESFQDLDGWLSRDGFIPMDWESDDEKAARK